MRPLLVAFALVLCVALPRLASAASCSITAVSGLAFGAYDIFSGSALESTGTITYRCNSVGVADTILIQLSAGNAGTFSPRTLLQGAYELEYNLFLDPSRTSVWGDGSSGTSQYGPVLPAENADTDVSVYGQIPSGQNARAGSYSDTVVVTIVF